MLVVNFFGGPDAGKSTMAAAVFAELKFNNVNCECVQEYVKDKIWEKSFTVLKDQTYVFGKQQHRLKRLIGQVEIALVDSPLILSIIYDKSKDYLFYQWVLQEFNQYSNLNFFLNRRDTFNQIGRIHTLEESKQKDLEIKELLGVNGIPFKEFNSSREAVKLITDAIMVEWSKNE